VTEEMFGGQHRVDEAETARAGWGDTNETGSHRDAISRAIGRVCSWTEKIRIKSLETVGVVRDNANRKSENAAIPDHDTTAADIRTNTQQQNPGYRRKS
jgi:hypothetical protein